MIDISIPTKVRMQQNSCVEAIPGKQCGPTPALRADYFGRKAFATITVVMGLIGGVLSAGFVFLNQAIFGPAGNYLDAFLLSMLIGLVAVGMVIFAKPPEVPHHKLPDHQTS
jgi:hypothetical protein